MPTRLFWTNGLALTRRRCSALSIRTLVFSVEEALLDFWPRCCPTELLLYNVLTAVGDLIKQSLRTGIIRSHKHAQQTDSTTRQSRAVAEVRRRSSFC